jgi:hypothetical protein
VIAASGPWNVPPSQAQFFGPHTVAVYYQQIPVDASKTIASVTLPDNPQPHLFDVGVPAAADFGSVAATANDTDLVPAASSSAGNYDGGGYSFSSDALAAAGLTPGAAVTEQGVSFTWPHYALGSCDNVRAEGQTIRLSGSGSTLGFLGSGGFGTQSGTVTISYADGTTQSATLTFADWYADNPVAGGTIVATVPWNPAPAARWARTRSRCTRRRSRWRPAGPSRPSPCSPTSTCTCSRSPSAERCLPPPPRFHDHGGFGTPPYRAVCQC